MITRLLVLAILVFIFLYGLRALALRALERWRALSGEPQPSSARSTERTGQRSGQPIRQVGELAPCSVCGVHVLSSRLVGDGQERYCSEACREKASARVR